MRYASYLMARGFGFGLGLAVLAVVGLHAFSAQQNDSQQSTLLSLEIRGRVATVHDDWNYLEGGIQAGDPFTVRMVFDSREKLVEQSDRMARYVQKPSSRTGISMGVAGRRFDSDQAVPWHIQIRNEHTFDRFLARAEVTIPAGFPGNPWDVHELVVSMTDDRGEQFDDTHLPTSLSPNGWSRVSCVLSFVRSPRFSPVRFHPGASVVVSGIVEEIIVRPTEEGSPFPR